MKLREIILLAGLFLAPSFLFGQGPDLTGTRFLTGDAIIGSAAGNQESPVITQGAGTFLAVWVDSRTNMFSSLLSYEGAHDIYATRLDGGGTILDQTPIIVSQEGGDQTNPKVAWNGENWLISWISQVPTQYYYTDRIVAARVSPAGILLDPTPITVVTFATSGNGELYDVASDGTNWMISWKDYVGSQWKIQGARISAQGTLIDPTPVTLHSTLNQPYQGAMTFAADEYFMVWKEWRSTGNDDLFARRFSTALSQLEPTAITVTSHADYDTRPRVTTNGLDFFVGWERYNTCCVGGGGKVYAARVSHAGSVLDPTALAVSGDVGETIGRNPSVSWDGTNYFIGWVVQSDLFAARVTPGGVVLDFRGFPVGSGSSNMTEPALCGIASGGVHMLWKDDRAGGILSYDIFKATISANGVVGPDQVISLGAPSQLESDVAGDGDGYIVAFRSEVSGTRRIMFQLLDAAGNPVGSEPSLLASGPQLSKPAVAWNGSLYLVVWASTDVPTIFGRRVSPDGALLDPSPITIMPGITPDVAAMGDVFLVVGTHNPVYFEFRHPFAVRVRGSDGAVLDGTPRQLGQYYAQNPSVSVLGGRWLATWQRNMSHDDPDANINAAFVNADGTSTTEVIVAGTYSLELYTPAVASGPDNALIVWRDSRNGFSNIDVFGRLVLPDGSMLTQFAVSTAAYDQDQPDVAWTGNEYVVVYKDQRNKPYFFDGRSDIYGTRVDPTGVVIDLDGFPIANSLLPEIHPSATGGNGVGLFAASLFQDQNPFKAYRVGFRFMGLEENQAPVVSDIPDQAVVPGGRFKPIRADNYVEDPDNPDSEITWTWTGNSAVRLVWDPVRRGIRIKFPNGWTGSETVVFTATDPGGMSDSDTARFTVTASLTDLSSGSAVTKLDNQAEATGLAGNYPNPFNPSTTIRFSLAEAGHVSIVLYNMLGQQVASLIDDVREKGTYELRFDGTHLASGTYIYRMAAGDYTQTKRLILMK